MKTKQFRVSIIGLDYPLTVTARNEKSARKKAIMRSIPYFKCTVTDADTIGYNTRRIEELVQLHGEW